MAISPYRLRAILATPLAQRPEYLRSLMLTPEQRAEIDRAIVRARLLARIDASPFDPALQSELDALDAADLARGDGR